MNSFRHRPKFPAAPAQLLSPRTPTLTIDNFVYGRMAVD